MTHILFVAGLRVHFHFLSAGGFVHKTILLLAFLSLRAVSGYIRLDSISSVHADDTLAVYVHVPDRYESEAHNKLWPVIYLLHCAGCRGSSWHGRTYSSNVTPYADSLDALIVAVDDGNRLGWWMDSPKLENSDMSRFLVEEVKPYIDSAYRTIDSPSATGVAGHSMGGYGALHNLIEHPDVFGAAFSIKGLVNLFGWIGKENWGLNELLGPFEGNYGNWHGADVVRNAYRLKGLGRHIGFYSGSKDWFGVGNRMLDDTLRVLEIPHYYKKYDEEGHTDVPPERLAEVMWFFDSVLVRATDVRFPKKEVVAIRKVDDRGCGSQFFDFRGRRFLRGGVAANGAPRILLRENVGRVRVYVDMGGN